jgi:hypothetical protein
MSIDPALGPSIQAFVVRNYSRCASLAGALLDKGTTLGAAHLYLTSRMRLGEKDQVAESGLRLIVSLSDPWEQAMAGLCIGRLNQDRLAEARTDLQRLQLIYYFGSLQVTLHGHKQAREMFRNFLLGSIPPVPSLELYLLGVENNYLTTGASGSDLDKPVIELNVRAEQLFGQGKQEEACKVAEQAHDLAEKTLGELHPAYITSVNNFGVIQHVMGRCIQARPLLEKHAELLRLAAGPEDPAYASALVVLATNVLKSRQGGELLDFDRTEKLLCQALDIQERALGKDDKQTAETRQILANVRQTRERASQLSRSSPPSPPAEKGPARGFWARLFGRESKAEPIRESYGFTPTDPILCHEPLGELEFLTSLRCPAGHRLRGRRVGSLAGKCTAPGSHKSLFPGDDPAQQCVVDRYESVCDGGEYSCTLYFDMYHPDLPYQPAPRGLSRVESA